MTNIKIDLPEKYVFLYLDCVKNKTSVIEFAYIHNMNYLNAIHILDTGKLIVEGRQNLN